MKTKLSKARVFALRGYSVKVEPGKYFVRPTPCFGNGDPWRGPYKSLQHATTAITRKLQAEIAERNGRLEKAS